MLRCIEIAYNLIKQGEKPTINGIKRAYDLKIDRNCTKESYERFDKDHFDFGVPPSPKIAEPPRTFISFSTPRENKRKISTPNSREQSFAEICDESFMANRERNFYDSIQELHKFESRFDDIDFHILFDNYGDLTDRQRKILDGKLQEVRESNPARYRHLNELFWIKRDEMNKK
jgi:hypothetical protein